MIGLVVKCARAECGKDFNKVTHNQKYCSNECCRIETNNLIKKKYHERMAIKRGAKRFCQSCGTSLSRYNETNSCGSCQTKAREKHAGEASRLVGSVVWL